MTKKQKAIYDKRYYHKNKAKRIATSKAYYRANVMNWLQLFYDLDFQSCEKCGYDKCWSALDFHHVKKSTKNLNIGQFIVQTCNEHNKATIIAELKKCILLCANCHRELHAEERRTPSLKNT